MSYVNRCGGRKNPFLLSLCLHKHNFHNFVGRGLVLGDPGAVSRVDKMSVVKVYCKIETSGACLDLTVNFHHGHFIDPTNCPWVSEDGFGPSKGTYGQHQKATKMMQDFVFFEYNDGMRYLIYDVFPTT